MEFFMGLLGAAAGGLLFLGGLLLGRRQKEHGRAGGCAQAEEAAAKQPPAVQPLTGKQWRELANFLNYDGGEMPEGKREEE